MAFFTITSDSEFQGATVIFADGSTQVIGSDNPNYEKVIAGLLPTQTLSDDQLMDLIAPFEAIYKTLTRLSERVSRKGSKLLFDGDVIKNALTDFIIKIMNEGDEAAYKAYIAFMEKLYTNPSEQSREHLFHFIEANGLQVTPDGDIVLYKGTEKSGLSSRAGYGIVNGIEYKNDQLPNSLGAVVEIPRSMVDDNRSATCSVGLHVGAYEYVMGVYQSQWPRLWTVRVNPRDVVAVPHDFKSSKIRVTRYQVVEDNTDTVKHSGLVWDAPVVKPAKTVKVTNKKIKPKTSAPATPAPSVAGSRVDEYKQLIKSGGAGKDLKRYRNKRVTPARRSEFDRAVQELGLQY